MPNEGATEDGRGRLAFFFSNALVKKVVISGEPKVKEVDPINYQEVGNLSTSTAARHLHPKNRRPCRYINCAL